MSLKVNDGQGRWRSHTIAFRISPEENDLLNKAVALSGLTKQDYIIRRVQHRDVVVVGNPRVYKALRDSLAEVLVKLEGGAPNEDLLEVMELITITLNGMKEENL